MNNRPLSILLFASISAFIAYGLSETADAAGGKPNFFLKIVDSANKPVVVDYEIRKNCVACKSKHIAADIETPCDSIQKSSASRIELYLEPGEYAADLKNPRVTTVGIKETNFQFSVTEGAVVRKTVRVNTFNSTRLRRRPPFAARGDFLEYRKEQIVSRKAFVSDRWARFEAESGDGRHTWWGLDIENDSIRMPVNEDRTCLELYNKYPTYAMFHEFPGMSEVCEPAGAIDGHPTEMCLVSWATLSRITMPQKIWRAVDMNGFVIRAENFCCAIEFHDVKFGAQEISPYICPSDYVWKKAGEF